MKTKLNYLNILLPIILLFAIGASAQVASYKFNGNLKDDLSTNNIIYEKLGASTIKSPVFEANKFGSEINLETKYGLNFPKSLIDQIGNKDSFELEFTIKVKVLGKDNSRFHILTNQDNWITNAGFAIYGDRQDTSAPDKFNLNFVYSDGGSYKGVPNHPIFTTTRLGEYKVGEDIKIKLIVELKSKAWITVLNNFQYSGRFNDTYVWADVLSALNTNKWYLNWIKDYQNVINHESFFYTTQINYDDINFYIPRRPANQASIKAALQEMTAHVGKTKTLTIEQRENYTSEITVGLSQVYKDLKTEVFNFTNTYEQNQPIIFHNRQQVIPSTLSPESRLLIALQQYIHDFEFTSENIDNVAGVKFKFAEIFPGKIKDGAPRITNGIVAINGKHISLKHVQYAYDNVPAKRPTGYYAAPGEIVTVTIPSHLINKGLKVQIGVHTADISGRMNTNRFSRVTKEFSLNQISTRIANPFGGPIYIRIPEPSDLGWFDIIISGAIKSPFFRLIPDHGTSLAEWQKDLSDHNVEWADVESEKYMMTLPWINFKSIQNPTSLLTQWNNIMEAYNYAGGFPPEAKIKADYFTVDCILPTAGAFGIGYPQEFANNNVPYDLNEFNAGYPTYVLHPNFIKPINNYDTETLFHEIGHSNSFPRVVGDEESIVHLYASYLYNKLYGFSIDEAFKLSSFQAMELNDASIDWMVSDNFRTNNPMSCDPLLEHLPDGECDEVRYQHRSHAKYSEIAKRFGWEFVHKMNKVFYDKNVALNLNAEQTKFITRDELIEAASDANKINMAPLFHFWGYIPSTTLAEKLKAKYAPDARLRDMLNHYKTVIPKTAGELTTYFNKFKDVVNNLRYTTYIGKYDSENYYQQINNQIDYILNYYCLNGLESVTTVTSCGSYTWENNGQTYTKSGIYTGTTTNCKTEKLHLTIRPMLMACLVSSQINNTDRNCGVTNVKLNTINKATSTFIPASAMQNFVCSDKTNLSTKYAYNLDVTFKGSILGGRQYLEVWIDWDNNGLFERVNSKGINERVLSDNALLSKTASIRFTPPANATLNTLLRMRVVSGSEQSQNATCGRGFIKRADDYGIIVNDKTTIKPLKIQADIELNPSLVENNSMLNDKKSQTDIEIYPNPVKDFLTISLKNNEEIENYSIYDATGKKVLSSSKTDNNVVDTSGLTVGLYFIKITTTTGELNSKFLKE